jgi:hypothetical protein
LATKEGGLIQVDINGYPPLPTGSKQFYDNFGNLLILAVFNFWGHFEGPNEGFLGSSFSMISKGSDLAPKMNLLDDKFPTSYHAPQTEIVFQSYAPRKLIHQTTQNGVHKIVGFSSSGVRVLYFIYYKKAFGTSL